MDVQKQKSGVFGKGMGAALLTLAAALALWLFVAANYRKSAVAEISRSLGTINAYKTAEISRWLEEHRREAARLSRHSFLGEIVSREISSPGSRGAQLAPWLKDHSELKEYTAMAFLSPDGAVITATPGYLRGTETPFKEAFAQAVEKRIPLLTDLYQTAGGGLRLTMFSPILAGGRGGKPLCVLVMKIDPERDFYPLLKAAPLFFTDAETLLVRREGGDVIFLNPLYHKKDSALKLRRPLSEQHLPAAAAIRGVSGFFAGLDYRGEKVFSFIGPVPGSNWSIITKVDRDSILAPVKAYKRMTLALILLGAGILYLTGYAILRARRLATEEALDKSRHLLAETEIIGKVGGWEFDIDTMQQVWTEEVYRIHELDIDYKLDVANGINFYAPESRPVIEQAVKRTLETGEGFDLELEIITSKGNTRSVQVIGKADLQHRRVYGFFQDITEQKRTMEALKRSEEKFRKFFENEPEYCYIISPQGNIEDVNQSALTAMGYSREELIGKPVMDIYAPETLPKARELFERWKKEGTLRNEELVIRAKSGERRVILLSAGMVRDPSGEILRSISVQRDITERKRADEALHKREADLKEAQHLAKIGSWEWDAKTDTINWSDEYYRIYGVDTSQRPPGYEDHLKAYTPESAARLDAAVKRNMQTGETYQLDLELSKKEGPPRYITARSETLRDAQENITGLRGTAQDITERKQMEAELQTHLRYFERMDMINQAIQVTNDPDQMMSNVLKAVREVLDCDRAWLFYPCDSDSPSFRVPMEITKPGYPGAKALNVDLPMPPDMVRDLREALGSAEPLAYTAGTESPVNETSARQFGVKSQMMVALYPKVGKPWVFGIHQCSYPRVWTPEELRLIKETGRRLADSLSNLRSISDLRESEHKLRDAQRLAHIGNWTLDMVSNKLTWSEEIYRILEIDKDKFGATYEAFLGCIHPEDRDYVDKAYADSLKSRLKYEVAHRLLMKDGRIKHVVECCETYYSDDGRPLASAGTVQDVTEHKLAQLELKRLNRDLVQKKLEMENFLYITTHDLRSPLVNIQGFSQNLERYIDELRKALPLESLGPEVRESLGRLTGDSIPTALKFVLASSRNMDTLISALLKVSRVGRVEMQPQTLEMNGLIKKIAASLSFQLEEAGGSIRTGPLPPCTADASAVTQIFANLLDNAIKYRAPERPLLIKVTGEVKAGMVLYTVADNGSGIPENDLQRIWNVFYRAGKSTVKHGEGIGLPMAKRLLEKNGGSIRAGSEEGKGSVFYIELPAPKRGER